MSLAVHFIVWVEIRKPTTYLLAPHCRPVACDGCCEPVHHHLESCSIPCELLMRLYRLFGSTEDITQCLEASMLL